MPIPSSTFGWGEALAWFGVIVIASFLVTWVLTDVFRVGRSWYPAGSGRYRGLPGRQREQFRHSRKGVDNARC